MIEIRCEVPVSIRCEGPVSRRPPDSDLVIVITSTNEGHEQVLVGVRGYLYRVSGRDLITAIENCLNSNADIWAVPK